MLFPCFVPLNQTSQVSSQWLSRQLTAVSFEHYLAFQKVSKVSQVFHWHDLIAKLRAYSFSHDALSLIYVFVLLTTMGHGQRFKVNETRTIGQGQRSEPTGQGQRFKVNGSRSMGQGLCCSVLFTFSTTKFNTLCCLFIIHVIQLNSKVIQFIPEKTIQLNTDKTYEIVRLSHPAKARICCVFLNEAPMTMVL